VVTAALLGAFQIPAAAAPTAIPGLLAWGANGAGQIGDGTTTTRQAPVAVATQDTAFSQIAAGQKFSMALTSDGRLFAWGDNSAGQLGTGTLGGSSRLPKQVTMPDAAAVVAIAAGTRHALAVTALGHVYGWGQNNHGETGTGTVSTAVATPTLVPMPAGVTPVAVAGGEGYSLALTSAGSVLAWGLNGHGQLGNGTTDKTLIALTPVFVTLPADTTVTAIGAGDHSVALTATGQVLCWGDNGGGQLGNGLIDANGSPLPVEVVMPAGTSATAIADNTGKSFAALQDGRVLAWGLDSDGQLGDGATVRVRATPVFVALPAGTDVVGLAAGGLDGFAVTAAGAIFAWGSDAGGRLGDGPALSSSTPVPVALPAGMTAAAVAAGGPHALAIVAPAAAPRSAPGRMPGSAGPVTTSVETFPH
jgi:alpha-tubulin suppressor-like RCC1 family protein